MRGTYIVAAILLALGGAARADATPPAHPPLAAVARALVGTWQSADDTRFSREFRADSSVTDSYEGDPDNSQSGKWLLFSGSAPPLEFAHKALAADGYYLEIRENGDTLLFGLASVDRATLQMINVDRGNTLSFTRLR